jgi:hypothetical protein
MLTTVLAAVVARVLTLTMHQVPGPGLRNASPIVGRASCGPQTFLLTQSRELVRVAAGKQEAFDVRAAKDIAATPDLWGLACLSDGTLWTLESGHSLVRLNPDGSVAARFRLQVPWIALFSAHDRLLFQALPTLAGTPALSTATAAALEAPKAWPGPTGRVAGDAASIARNLVRCGISGERFTPCWFANDDGIVLSDGVHVERRDLPTAHLTALDRTMPIWDVAVTTPPIGANDLASRDRIWLLGNSVPAGGARRAADTMVAIDTDGRSARIRLTSPARLIVFAAFERCTVLLATGQLLEIHAA